jgi:hypothetical protein
LLSVYGEISEIDQDNLRVFAKNSLLFEFTLFRMVLGHFKHFFDAGVVRNIFVVPAITVLQEEYVDLSIAPDAVVAQGKGKATEGMLIKFEGGPTPKE